MFIGTVDSKCYSVFKEYINRYFFRALTPMCVSVMLLYVTFNLLISYPVNNLDRRRDANKRLILFSVFQFQLPVKTHI